MLLSRSAACRALAVLVLATTLSGCDAWPTTAVNRSASTVVLSYRHREHDQWSAPFPIAAGQSLTLARAHYFEDFVGLAFVDGGRIYRVPPAELARLERPCARSLVDRLTTGGDCLITYLGEGRIRVQRGSPTRP